MPVVQWKWLRTWYLDTVDRSPAGRPCMGHTPLSWAEPDQVVAAAAGRCSQRGAGVAPVSHLASQPARRPWHASPPRASPPADADVSRYSFAGFVGVVSCMCAAGVLSTCRLRAARLDGWTSPRRVSLTWTKFLRRLWLFTTAANSPVSGKVY